MKRLENDQEAGNPCDIGISPTNESEIRAKGRVIIACKTGADNFCMQAKQGTDAAHDREKR